MGKISRLSTVAGLLVVAYLLVQVAIFQIAHQEHGRFPTSTDFFPYQHVEFPPLDFDAELQKSREYLATIRSSTRDLKFLHIPKSAGTTIEHIGGDLAKPKVAWGSCLFNHLPKRRHTCEYPPGQFQWPSKIGYWHLPPHLFPLMRVNPYEDADLFAVVRDPYDRLVSEFYYVCKRKRTKHADRLNCDPDRMFDVEYMNQWIRTSLQNVTEDYTKAENYFIDNGHYTPQFQFLVAPYDIRRVDHVFRMDEINEKLLPLLESYGIKARLEVKNSNLSRNHTDLTVQDLDSTTRQLIRKHFAADFMYLFQDVK